MTRLNPEQVQLSRVLCPPSLIIGRGAQRPRVSTRWSAGWPYLPIADAS